MLKNCTFPYLFCVMVVLAFVMTHLVWPFSLPPPWPDESYFLIPAASFANNASLSSGQMLVPNIYWIPSSFYIINGLVFFLMGHVNLDIARTVSFASITCAAWILREVLSVALGTAGLRWPLISQALTLAWYLSLPVVFAGNIARPDALVIFVSVASVYCLLRWYIVGALGLAALAMLLHPLLGIPCCAAVATSLPAFRRITLPNVRNGWWEWLILAIATGLFAVEILRLVNDFAEYRGHWIFQLSRKADREIGWFFLLSLALAMAAFIVSLLLNWRDAGLSNSQSLRRLQILVFGFFCILVHLYGQEMWYFPFLLLGLVLVAGVFLGSLRTDYRAKAKLFGSSILPLAIIAVGWSTWGIGLRSSGVYGFQLRPAALAKIDGDRLQMLITIRDRIRKENLGSVLVDPVLVDLVIDDRDRVGTAYLTWSPFSRRTDEQFGHVVVVEQGYPAFHTDLPTSLLTDHVCRSEERVISPNGIYKIRIVTVASNATKGRPFIECPPP